MAKLRHWKGEDDAIRHARRAAMPWIAAFTDSDGEVRRFKCAPSQARAHSFLEQGSGGYVYRVTERDTLDIWGYSTGREDDRG